MDAVFCKKTPSVSEMIDFTEKLATKGIEEPKKAFIYALLRVFNSHCMFCLEKVDEQSCKNRKFKTAIIKNFLKVKNFTHSVCEKCKKAEGICKICQIEDHVNMI